MWTVPSKKLLYTNWLSHENVAWEIGAKASPIVHWKTTWHLILKLLMEQYSNFLISLLTNYSICIYKNTCFIHSSFLMSYMASWVSVTASKCIWSCWNWIWVSDLAVGVLPTGACKKQPFCLSQWLESHTMICKNCISTRYKSLSYQAIIKPGRTKSQKFLYMHVREKLYLSISSRRNKYI